MSVKSEIDNLKSSDIYSILLFALYKCKNTNEFSALSEMAFILDEENLLNLCEYFGGLTITIPTIEELELMLVALNIYKSVNIDGKKLEAVLDIYSTHRFSQMQLKNCYAQICDVMSNYTFGE